MSYDYKCFVNETEKLKEEFPFVKREIIGKSVMKKPIYCIKIGDGDKKLFINGAHHGLEYLTSAVIMKFVFEYAEAIKENSEFFGYDAKEIAENVSLYAVPMVNPDGVDIAINGLDITNPYHQKLISSVGIHSFNKVWQANARGVDINHNYNASWRVVKTKPCESKYAGPYSESEPETKAMVDFVRKMNFDILIAFHSQGKEIYYDFDGTVAENSRKLAEEMAKVSGYAVCTPTGSAAFGGCKDWFIKEFGKAGFTVEIGSGKNPLPLEKLNEIYDENAKIILKAMEELYEKVH